MVCAKCPHYHSVSQVLYFPALNPTPTYCEMNIWISTFLKECCAMNNPRNPLRTQLLGKAHMEWTGPQAAHSEPWVTALHPGKQQAQHHESLLPAAHPIPAPRPTRLACATRLGGWARAWIPEVNCLKIMLIINCCINTAEGWWTAWRRWDLARGKHVFGRLCCENLCLFDCSSRLQQGCERSGIDRILRSCFVGAFKHFTAVTAVNLNSIPFSATFSSVPLRMTGNAMPDQPVIPVVSALCRHWPARLS